MQKYLDILKNSALFSGIDTKDLINMFKCLLMNIKTYEKNSYILKASEPLVEVGIILKGRVNIIKEDYWGNRTILTTLSTGDLFGESFVCTNINNNCFSIVTAEKAEIMFLNYQKITSPCQFACNFHSKIIQNMLLLIAKKNIQLTTKIDHLSKKTTREKILPFTSHFTEAFISPSFVVILTVDGSCSPAADFSTPFARLISDTLPTAVSLAAASVTVKLTGIFR